MLSGRGGSPGTFPNSVISRGASVYPLLASTRVPEVAERVVVHVADRAAALAHEVVVRVLVRGLVEDAVAAEVGPQGEPGLDEHVECPVHGRRASRSGPSRRTRSQTSLALRCRSGSAARTSQIIRRCASEPPAARARSTASPAAARACGRPSAGDGRATPRAESRMRGFSQSRRAVLHTPGTAGTRTGAGTQSIACQADERGRTIGAAGRATGVRRKGDLRCRRASASGRSSACSRSRRRALALAGDGGCDRMVGVWSRRATRATRRRSRRASVRAPTTRRRP
jgi:hypothetical protein